MWEPHYAAIGAAGSNLVHAQVVQSHTRLPDLQPALRLTVTSLATVNMIERNAHKTGPKQSKTPLYQRHGKVLAAQQADPSSWQQRQAQSNLISYAWCKSTKSSSQQR